MDIGRKNIRFIQIGSLCLLLCFYAISLPLNANQYTLSHVERLLEQFEAAEAGQDTDISLENIMKQLTEANEQLIAHLHVHPNDVKALIISVRLGRIRQLVEPIVLTPGQKPTDSKTALVPFHTNLDRALVLEPKNAEAHYWKARLYGLRIPVVRAGRIYYVPANLDQAIRYSRKAVKLAPKSSLYREALALYLVEDQKPKEAINVIQSVADKHHPIYLLLNDLNSLPIPKTATLSKNDSESFAQQQITRGRFQDYPQLRVRFYILPMSVPKLEKFYSNYWDGFKFFSKGEPNKVGDGEMRFFAQHLTQQRDDFLPATTESEIPKVPSSGILLSATELHNLPVELRHQTPTGFDIPSNVGEVFSYLIVVNFRTFK